MDAGQNVEQAMTSSTCDTKGNFNRQDAALNSNFTRSVAPSDSYVIDSQTQVRTSFNNGDDKAEIEAYILSVGTKSKSTESQALHKRLLDESINYLATLLDHHTNYEILLQDGISQTQQWGLIHTFYVKILGSQSMTYGTAALLGTMLKQQAIGINHPLTKDDHLILSSTHGQPLPNNFHQYFTVYSPSLILRSTTLKIIETVCERFPALSGQLDTSGQSIEFHDFDLSYKGTSAEIEEILKENFQQTFQVRRHFAKSTLLTRNDYQQALDASGLKIDR